MTILVAVLALFFQGYEAAGRLEMAQDGWGGLRTQAAAALEEADRLTRGNPLGESSFVDRCRLHLPRVDDAARGLGAACPDGTWIALAAGAALGAGTGDGHAAALEPRPDPAWAAAMAPPGSPGAARLAALAGAARGEDDAATDTFHGFGPWVDGGGTPPRTPDWLRARNFSRALRAAVAGGTAGTWAQACAGATPPAVCAPFGAVPAVRPAPVRDGTLRHPCRTQPPPAWCP